MPIIYVDFDDVLCETARGLIDLLETEHGKRVAYEEIHWFELDRSFGLTAEELRGFFQAAHRPECIEGLEPVPGAREVIARWQAEGFEVWVVTGRPPETAASSRAWLEAHGVPYDRLLFVDKYRRLPPGPDLVSLDDLAGTEFALAIDDAPAMLQYLLDATPVPVLIYDRPWNRRFTTPNGRTAHRCRSWEEIATRAEAFLSGPAAATEAEAPVPPAAASPPACYRAAKKSRVGSR